MIYWNHKVSIWCFDHQIIRVSRDLLSSYFSSHFILLMLGNSTSHFAFKNLFLLYEPQSSLRERKGSMHLHPNLIYPTPLFIYDYCFHQVFFGWSYWDRSILLFCLLHIVGDLWPQALSSFQGTLVLASFSFRMFSWLSPCYCQSISNELRAPIHWWVCAPY